MFTPGRVWFVVIFIVSFLIVMIYAYREDLKTIRPHYAGVYRVFIVLLIFLLLLYLLVKLRTKL